MLIIGQLQVNKSSFSTEHFKDSNRGLQRQRARLLLPCRRRRRRRRAVGTSKRRNVWTSERQFLRLSVQFFSVWDVKTTILLKMSTHLYMGKHFLILCKWAMCLYILLMLLFSLPFTAWQIKKRRKPFIWKSGAGWKKNSQNEKK